MTTHDGVIRRLAAGAVLLAAAGPLAWAVVGPGPAHEQTVAACPQGEHLDPTTFWCMPGPLPAAVDVAPGLTEQWEEQDVLGTPGVDPDPAQGTTVP